MPLEALLASDRLMVPVGAIEDPQDDPALNDEAMAPIAEPVIDDAPAPSVEASSAIDEQHPKSTEEDR